MVAKLIIRGIFVGIVAGLLAFGWAKTFGEPSVDIAIAYEGALDEKAAQADAAAGIPAPPEEPALVSREEQSGLGLLTGTVGLGAGLGGLFGVLFAFGNGRMGSLGAGATSTVLAAIGFVTIYVVPAIKYPPSPPATSDDNTIALRTGLYFLMMAISVAATFGALALRKRLAATMGWNGSALAGVAYFVLITAVVLILPPISETPADFSAVTLWDFRTASFGIQAVLWMSLGVLFGMVSEMSAKKAR